MELATEGFTTDSWSVIILSCICPYCKQQVAWEEDDTTIEYYTELTEIKCRNCKKKFGIHPEDFGIEI